jgi:hypothetical protein
MAMTCGFGNGATGNCVWGFLGNPVLDEVRDTRLYGSGGSSVPTARPRIIAWSHSTPGTITCG